MLKGVSMRIKSIFLSLLFFIRRSSVLEIRGLPPSIFQKKEYKTLGEQHQTQGKQLRKPVRREPHSVPKKLL